MQACPTAYFWVKLLYQKSFRKWGSVLFLPAVQQVGGCGRTGKLIEKEKSARSFMYRREGSGETKRDDREIAHKRCLRVHSMICHFLHIGRDPHGVLGRARCGYARGVRGKLCCAFFRHSKPRGILPRAAKGGTTTRLIYCHASFFHQPFHRRPYKLSIPEPATSRLSLCRPLVWGLEPNL